MVIAYVLDDRARARQRVDGKTVDPIEEVLRAAPAWSPEFGWDVDTELVAEWEAPWTE